MQSLGHSLDVRMALVRKVVNSLIVILFAVQVIVVFSQVVWRFVFNNPFTWSEELARYLQVWLILLAATACIRKGRHLTVDFATHALPLKTTKLLKLIIMIFILLFTGVLIVFGIQMIVVTIHQIAPALRLPVLTVYIAFPVSGFLMFAETLILFLRLTGVKDKAGMDALYG